MKVNFAISRKQSSFAKSICFAKIKYPHPSKEGSCKSMVTYICHNVFFRTESQKLYQKSSHIKTLRRGIQVAQSVKRQTSAQVMISWFVSLSPTSGSVMTAQSLEPVLGFCVSLSFSAPPLLMLCLSLSKMNKLKKKNLKTDYVKNKQRKKS